MQASRYHESLRGVCAGVVGSVLDHDADLVAALRLAEGPLECVGQLEIPDNGGGPPCRTHAEPVLVCACRCVLHNRLPGYDGTYFLGTCGRWRQSHRYIGAKGARGKKHERNQRERTQLTATGSIHFIVHPPGTWITGSSAGCCNAKAAVPACTDPASGNCGTSRRLGYPFQNRLSQVALSQRI